MICRSHLKSFHAMKHRLKLKTKNFLLYYLSSYFTRFSHKHFPHYKLHKFNLWHYPREHFHPSIYMLYSTSFCSSSLHLSSRIWKYFNFYSTFSYSRILRVRSSSIDDEFWHLEKWFIFVNINNDWVQKKKKKKLWKICWNLNLIYISCVRYQNHANKHLVWIIKFLARS